MHLVVDVRATPLSQLLKRWKGGTAREANLALYKSLSPEQWKHYGMHAERGQESVEHIVNMLAGHDV